MVGNEKLTLKLWFFGDKTKNVRATRIQKIPKPRRERLAGQILYVSIITKIILKSKYLSLIKNTIR